MTSQKIEVIADTDDFLVVNKPASIPVHPVARFRHNSIPYILAKEHNFKNLRGKASSICVLLKVQYFVVADLCQV